MITRPLDLESRLSPPPRDFTTVAWVNVGVIVLFFSLLGSRFVLAPGLEIELPTADPADITATETSVVVAFKRDNLIVFQGGKYTLTELKPQFEAYARAHPRATLLVLADQQVSAQALGVLGALAKSVGFEARMVLAAEPAKSATPSN